MNYREADGQDKVATYAKADVVFAKLASGVKAAHKFIQPVDAINYLFDTSGISNYIIDDTYLVSYVITPPWPFAGATVVQELLIVKLYDNGGEFNNVLDFLTQEAKTFQCVGVVVGTGLRARDQGMAAALQAHGFTPLSWEHFKPTE